MAVPKAIAAKVITCRVGLKRRAASFRVAGVALRDFPTRFLTCQTSFCARISEDDFHFSWQTQHFGDLHLHYAGQAQHLRRVVLRFFCESHCQGCAVTTCKWAWDIVRVSFCTAGAVLVMLQLATLDSTPPLPSTLFVSYAIPRSPLCTLHCTVDIPHPQSTPYNQHSTIYTLQSTLYIPHIPHYTPHFTL